MRQVEVERERETERQREKERDSNTERTVHVSLIAYSAYSSCQ